MSIEKDIDLGFKFDNKFEEIISNKFNQIQIEEDIFFRNFINSNIKIEIESDPKDDMKSKMENKIEQKIEQKIELKKELKKEEPKIKLFAILVGPSATLTRKGQFPEPEILIEFNDFLKSKNIEFEIYFVDPKLKYPVKEDADKIEKYPSFVKIVPEIITKFLKEEQYQRLVDSDHPLALIDYTGYSNVYDIVEEWEYPYEPNRLILPMGCDASIFDPYILMTSFDGQINQYIMDIYRWDSGLNIPPDLDSRTRSTIYYRLSELPPILRSIKLNNKINIPLWAKESKIDLQNEKELILMINSLLSNFIIQNREAFLMKLPTHNSSMDELNKLQSDFRRLQENIKL